MGAVRYAHSVLNEEAPAWKRSYRNKTGDCMGIIRLTHWIASDETWEQAVQLGRPILITREQQAFFHGK